MSPYPYSHLANMKYVYLIQSIPFPTLRYVGVTSDLKTRLTSHNEGQSPHTSETNRGTQWLDFGDPQVASFRRSRSGSIAPITNTQGSGKSLTMAFYAGPLIDRLAYVGQLRKSTGIGPVDRSEIDTEPASSMQNICRPRLGFY
jgi:hypothetical protein